MTDCHSDRPIEPPFLERWSPRAFDGSAVSGEDRLRMFEAARWGALDRQFTT
jgi:hypothetical protein